MCIKNVRPPSLSDIDRNRIKSKIHINSIFFLFRIHFYKFILILDIFIRMYYVIHISLIRVFFKLFMTVSGGRGNGASRSAEWRGSKFPLPPKSFKNANRQVHGRPLESPRSKCLKEPRISLSCWGLFWLKRGLWGRQTAASRGALGVPRSR